MSGSIEEQIIAAEAEAQKAQARIDRLKKIQEVLQDPESEALLRDALGLEVVQARNPIGVSGGATAFDRLKIWFASRGNAPATIAAMAQTTGVSVSAIRQIVYRNRADDFVNKGRGDTRETLFCMKQEDELKGREQ